MQFPPADEAQQQQAFRRAFAIKLKKADGEPVRIVDGLFIGSIGAAHNIEGLKRAGITHVLSMSQSSGAKFPDDFTYKSITIDDKPGRRIVAHFRECFGVEKGRSAGELCSSYFQGKSRSTAVILVKCMPQARARFARQDAHCKTDCPAKSRVCRPAPL